eukprot:NODE_305_length_1685_cov_141.693252.p1 GENE.NODE_305_length_1685_cov_141.693252~~NODE_305_length_1685_cov_141.693252.p1  ORF type:complete len:535 (-),score=139.21 NODE_305_length_1685_cov_141.693252:79-1449(-)
MLVCLGSCPQGTGHVVVKKMLYPPSLLLLCLLEIPSAEGTGAMLRQSLEGWLRQWRELQAARPDVLIAICETFWEPAGHPVSILCEHMPLGSLDELIQACGGLPEDALRDIALAVLQALDTLHSADPPVVHGDLKPSQVLFTANGCPKLSFGLEQRLRSCQAWAASANVSDKFFMPVFEESGRASAPSDNSMYSRPVSGGGSALADIADLGLLMLVSALGGLDVLLDAIPHARELGSLPKKMPSSSSIESANGHMLDTCSVLQRELNAFVEAPAAAASDDGSSAGLPSTADLLFNRSYSTAFLTFVSTCLEAQMRTTRVSAKHLLDHEFLRPSRPRMAPLVSLHEMHELARMLNEASEQDPGATSTQQYTVVPSVAHSAEVYLGNVAKAVAVHCSRLGSGAMTQGTDICIQRVFPVAGDCEALLLDTARTLGLPRSSVQRVLEAQLERRTPEASAD